MCCFSCIAVDAGSSVTRLQIGVKHRPEVCSRRAQPGDEIAVHYKVSRHALSTSHWFLATFTYLDRVPTDLVTL